MTDIITEISYPGNPVIYSGKLLASNSSDKQVWQILKTEKEGDILFIDDQFQSCTKDESIYHEWFVHSLMIGALQRKKVLVLGGAEGCIVREVLKWKDVESVVQYEWDQSLVDYFKKKGEHWNSGSYNDARLKVVCEDAMKMLKTTNELFDCIFVDLLDPTEDSMNWFSELLLECKLHLAPSGGLIINAGFVRKNTQTAACGVADLIKHLFSEYVYNHNAMKVFVPSFLDEWCFLMVTSRFWSSEIQHTTVPSQLKHFTKRGLIDALRWDGSYPEDLKIFWKNK